MKGATLGIVAVYAALIGSVRFAIWRDGRRRQREEIEAEARRWAEAARVKREAHHTARQKLRRLQSGGTPAA